MENDTGTEETHESKAGGFPAGQVFLSGIAGLTLAACLNSSALLNAMPELASEVAFVLKLKLNLLLDFELPAPANLISTPIEPGA